MVKNLPGNAGDLGSIPGLGMTTHSSILAWEIRSTEKPGRLQFIRVAKNRTGVSD